MLQPENIQCDIQRDAAPCIELGELIDLRPMSRAQILVVVLCATMLFVDGYDIQVMALAVPALASEWSLPPSTFGWSLAAVGVGLSLGSGLLGSLGDRYGRRMMLVVTMSGVALATGGTALAATPEQFVVWRFITGVALGAGIPSCAAMTSEYAPLAYRSQVMGLMNCASPIGAFSAGFIAPPVLDAFGWRGAFIIGGAATLAIALATLFIPESLKFLLARHARDPHFATRIAATLRRVAPEIDPARLSLHASTQPRRSVFELLAPEFRARSLLLWAMLCLNLFNLYVLISWLPTLLQQVGWSLTAALRGAVFIQAGGVIGGLTLARFLDRGATKAALVCGFCLSALCLLLLSVAPSGVVWVVLLLFIGAGVSGSQLSLNALSAAYYPPAIKATGVAWALVIGSFGSIVAPLAGAWMIDMHWLPTTIFALLALPSLLCAAGVALMRREWQAH